MDTSCDGFSDGPLCEDFFFDNRQAHVLRAGRKCLKPKPAPREPRDRPRLSPLEAKPVHLATGEVN